MWIINLFFRLWIFIFFIIYCDVVLALDKYNNDGLCIYLWKNKICLLKLYICLFIYFNFFNHFWIQFLWFLLFLFLFC
jgi:hypothetical protein